MSKKQDKEIKIFVSHRIDLESNTINNPLYVDVRCGAVFDKRKNINMLGDDTGDNISEKKDEYSEFTVQYWAWKNVKADYYGLCHYRRYLSFIDEYIDCDEPHRFAVEKYINRFTAKKYGLNKKAMKKEIKKYDVITSLDFPVDNLNIYPKPANEYELWSNHPNCMIGKEEITLLLDIIKEKFPVYYETACELMYSTVHKGYNCFIMKKDLFFQMCEFEFTVLFELEKRLDFSKYAGYSERTIGFAGEILYSIFMLYIKEIQIVFFTDTRKNNWRDKEILRDKIKLLMTKIWPSYRVGLRVEEYILKMQTDIYKIKRELNIIKTQEKIKFWTGEPVFADDLNTIKQNFWHSFPKADGDLRLIQKGNTKLLETFKHICDKLDIKFWLHGGSLVGAVRHNGFVPWDDDIDIAMMRDDFEKLNEYLKTSEYYEIGEFYYTSPTCRSYRFKRKDLNSGFFVDIFLYDNYKKECINIIDDWKKMLLHKKGIEHQWLMFLTKENIEMFNNIRLEDNVLLKEYLDKLINIYINKFKSENKSEYITWGIDNNFENHTKYAYNHGRIFKYDDIFPLKECMFEGNLYNIPLNFEKYVFAEYGIGYLEMPDTIGISAHIKTYFKDMDIQKIYDELIMTENKINGFIQKI